MKKNDLIKTEDGIYRILSIEANRVLAIDCIKKTMPKFYPVSSFGNGKNIDCIPVDFTDMEDLSPADRKVAQERYTMIASAVSVVDDTQQRNLMIEKSSKQFGMSKQSIRSFLCSYLVYQDVAVLAPKQSKEKELTEDQKNMRWALNKFFYTRNQNSLPTAYAMMLKAKYCDAYGVLLPDYPSYNQFRYFYRKHRKMENYYISRDGIKDYQRNNRPLLGDGVQAFAPAIGTAMLDGTTCDIYLVNEYGQLVGRPVLVIACDANTSLCLGYSLLWEGGTYSLQTLMLNILEDKVALCERMGIRITSEQWAVNQLPAVMVTDGGSEYKGQTFEQIAELGVTLVNLPTYRPELKGSVEKLFDLVQKSYKDLLKGKGVIMQDFQERGSHDYRKDAVLTMQYGEEFREFCKVLLEYCYVQQIPMVDEPLLMWLYNHSSGNASVVVGLIHDAQEIAILEGWERLDVSTLNIAFEKRMTMLHDFLTPKSAKTNPVKKKKADLPDVVEEHCAADLMSIYQVSMNAKEFQNDMENNKNRTAYVIYNQRLAGFLMMHGFVLLGLAPRPNGKNLFMFNDTDALHDAIDKWQIERLNKNNQ